MKNNKGFIELRNVDDYWKKLNFDFENLKQDDENVYVAFNFFVTAYHLIDWIFEGQYTEERTVLNRKPIVKLCNHVANGIKHFETKAKRHNSVDEIKKDRYIEEGYVAEGYVESPIVIYLDDNMIPEFGESIKIAELAEKVMKFWKLELFNRKLIN